MISLREFYDGRITKIVSLEEWVAALEASSGDDADLERNPGLKLLSTYRGSLEAKKCGQVMRFSMERTKRHSQAMDNVG